MLKLLHLLADQLLFFLDPHGYSIVSSEGSAKGSAYIDMKRGDLVWRLIRDRGEDTLSLRLREDREYPEYSTDILKRWLTGERDDEASLLTDDIAEWLREHLSEIEQALDRRRAETVAEWESLKRVRATELFG